MGGRDAERLVWSRRSTRWTSEQATQARAALAASVERVIQLHFPASAGYTTSKTALSGMLDGTRLSVARGEFRAVVSTQHFTEPVPMAPNAPRRHAIRLVGSIREPAGGERADELTQQRALAMLAAFTLLTALLFYLTWVPGFWGTARATLMFGFVIMMTPAIAWLLNPAAFSGELQGSALRALPVAERDPVARAGEDHRTRWREFREAVNAEDVVILSLNALPFRR
ncbi:MAG: hypothetical protein H6713_29990 [Myxococcales bacterium]|nr:hypothetical protein [Myxococcales bacterium]MCB9754195.1 hypothetical protein [Myxococcales bacterium]